MCIAIYPTCVSGQLHETGQLGAIFCMEILCCFEENMLSNHIYRKLLWRMVSKWMIPLNDTMYIMHAY